MWSFVCERSRPAGQGSPIRLPARPSPLEVLYGQLRPSSSAHAPAYRCCHRTPVGAMRARNFRISEYDPRTPIPHPTNPLRKRGIDCTEMSRKGGRDVLRQSDTKLTNKGGSRDTPFFGGSSLLGRGDSPRKSVQPAKDSRPFLARAARRGRLPSGDPPTKICRAVSISRCQTPVRHAWRMRLFHPRRAESPCISVQRVDCTLARFGN